MSALSSALSPVLCFVAAIGLSRAGHAAGLGRPSPRQAALGLALLAGLGLAGREGYDYWTVGRYLQSTDDAYIRADYTTVSPRLSGYITEVLVRDNEPVRAGQVVARLDDRDFRVALDEARAELGSADAVVRHLDARIAQQQATIDQGKADIAAGKATLALAEAENERYGDLRKSGYGSVQRAQQAETVLRERLAQLRKSRAGLLGARRSVEVLQSERARAEAQRDRASAGLRQDELNLGYTSIVAPIDGTVGARSLRVGQYVQAGTPLLAVVPLQAVYVVANFKETQLARMQPGQPVAITVDSFPDVTLRGHVDSVAPASGLQFSLLSGENATGNFTKIVQRVPVRIAIDHDTLSGRLRPGMSVRATVDTRTGGGP
ncbi:HlyD family secretion protein [Reyranella sp.]|uniref:HlyD family secretion protein n=1 Tax=Reyranella sp. TaxID=1929291 RepID=UPI003BACA6E8